MKYLLQTQNDFITRSYLALFENKARWDIILAMDLQTKIHIIIISLVCNICSWVVLHFASLLLF